MFDRIGFDEAIGEPLLFQKQFTALSPPQQAILKIIYGLPLSATELRYWGAFNGAGIYDELGYLVDVVNPIPYQPTEFEDVTLLLGRRSGKTSGISSLVVAYEALCGGHSAHLGMMTQQLPVFLQVAQDLDTAKANLRQFILDHLLASPIGKQELGDIKQTVTADDIRLKTGLITVGPPSIKLRSQAVAVFAGDELAMWAKERDAAQPDFEVQRAITPSQAQFPFRKRVKSSTPWTEIGLLWEASRLGTYGRFAGSPPEHAKTLVLHAPTAAMENPLVSRAFLRGELARDPDNFEREYLAHFSKSESGFLSASLLRGTVQAGVQHRPYELGHVYVAALDPAFRRDAFAFAIGHLSGGRFVLDHCQSWRGTSDRPISPSVVLAHVGLVCKEYKVRSVLSDQYHLESLQELGDQHGLNIEPLRYDNQLKKTMWGEFQFLLNQGRMDLLEHPELLAECMALEKHLTPGGALQIYGRRDDHAMVVALCLHRCLQMGERSVTAQAPVPVTHAEQLWAAINSRHKSQNSPWWN